MNRRPSILKHKANIWFVPNIRPSLERRTNVVHAIIKFCKVLRARQQFGMSDL